MQYVGWLLLAAAAVWSLGWAHSIRVTIRNGGSLTQQTVNIGMLMVIAVLTTFLLGMSPFHLLWMFPVGFVMGTLSLAFPFSLISIPGRLYGMLCTVGLDATEVARNQARHEDTEQRLRTRWEALVASGVDPTEALRQTKAEEGERLHREGQL